MTAAEKRAAKAAAQAALDAAETADTVKVTIRVTESGGIDEGGQFHPRGATLEVTDERAAQLHSSAEVVK